MIFMCTLNFAYTDYILKIKQVTEIGKKKKKKDKLCN